MLPTLSNIEAKWRASGSGVCVIVEGETELADAWFYNFWFGDRAREVTFFPQDGWEQVVAAVAALRTRLGPKKVYGIIDRDFVDPTYVPFPADGILRTRKYTLENYLLDPLCWFKWAHPYTQRNPRPGWDTEDAVRETIESLYRECIPLSAYNWTLHQAHKLDCAAFAGLSDREKAYARHPRTLKNWDAPSRLRNIQAQMGLPYDLSSLYTDRLAALQAFTLAALEQVVTGKAVLRLLRKHFLLDQPSKRAWDNILSAYVHTCPDPPTDLKTLVDLILEDAHS